MKKENTTQLRAKKSPKGKSVDYVITNKSGLFIREMRLYVDGVEIFGFRSSFWSGIKHWFNL